MEDLFLLAFGIVLLVVGGAFVVVSKKTVWRAIDAKSVETNPIRRFVRERFSTADARSMSVGRVVMLTVGLISVVLGVAILWAVLMNAR